MVQSQSGSLRGLKALVAVLGILMVLGTAVVVGVVIKRISARVSASSQAFAPLAQASPATTTLPPGARILGLTGAGRSFALWIATPAGAEVYLLDPATGALRLVVRTAPAN